MSALAVCGRGPMLAAIIFAWTTAAFAADGRPSGAVSASEVIAARQSAVRAAQALQTAGATRQAVAAAGGIAQPSEVFANPFRAYPPSCLSGFLPFRSFPQNNTDPAPQQQTL